MQDDVADDRIEITENIASRDTQCPKSSSEHNPVSRFIRGRPIAAIVSLAVDLDSQTDLKTREIERVRWLRVLPAKFEAARSLAQGSP